MQYDYDSKDILRLLDEKRDFETMGQLFDTLKAALDRALQREDALLDGGVAGVRIFQVGKPPVHVF